MSDAKAVLKGRYEIERELAPGEGGMAKVFLARDVVLMGRRVVVKVLNAQMSADEWVQKKFLQEMEALARIDHPGVVGVLDSGLTDAGKQFLVIQYVEGVTLRRAIEAGLTFERAAGIIRQIGQALSAAHEKGVFHRDLKPENVMLQSLSSGEDRVILIDFGIAGVKDSTFKSDKTMVAGSSAYMAPEQFEGRPSAASDTYALGVVAYEMLTGRKPFASGSFAHLASAEAAKTARPRELRQEIPEAAERAILKAMSFRPEDRHAAVREFSEELFAALTARARPDGDKGGLELSHVLFMDLVGYSLLPMDSQKDCLTELQRIVRESPRHRSAAANRQVITLPTGDGMAVAFFGDPTAAVQCALEVAAAVKSRPQLQLRMGIHSGPVFRLADINANSNVAGGGINLAQRVMDCGDPGHILLSKAVADVLLQLSGWGPYLKDLGEHPVKQGVRIHLYNLVTADVGNPARPKKLGGGRAIGRRAAMLALAAALAAVLLGAVGWGAWRLWTQDEPLEMSYFITVQRHREGKPYGEAFRLPGEIVFEADYRIYIPVSSLQAGYLYILNHGIEGETGKPSLKLLVPRPGRSALTQAGVSTPLGPIRFDTAVGRETLYLVMAREELPELEALKQRPQQQTYDAAEMKRIQDDLEARARGVQVTRDDVARETRLKTTGKVLVHVVPLEHL